MTLTRAQADLNARFTYRADRIDAWSILSGSGPVSGDCEDYALTLIYLAEGRSVLRFWWALLTFKYVLWFAIVGGSGHAVLWCRGHGWTDNIHRRVVSDLGHSYRLLFPWPVPLMVFRMVLSRIIKIVTK